MLYVTDQDESGPEQMSDGVSLPCTSRCRGYQLQLCSLCRTSHCCFMQTEHGRLVTGSCRVSRKQWRELRNTLHYMWVLHHASLCPLLQDRSANQVMLAQGPYNTTPRSLPCYFSVLANGLKCFSRCKLNIKRHLHVESLVCLLYKE